MPMTDAATDGGAVSRDDVADRTVIQAPRLADETVEAAVADDGSVLIKAEPTKAGDECRFLLNRTVLDGFSWWFEEAQDAVDSPLVEALFNVEGVEGVLVDESTVIVRRQEGDRFADWRPIAEAVGQSLRASLDSEEDPIGPSIVSQLPEPATVEETVQQVIEKEINPGVAAHSGFISLVRVRGNSVTISMGGGCQGCSAADVTLRQGIHKAFRDAMPEIGAIYDETDHAAGLNPYFS